MIKPKEPSRRLQWAHEYLFLLNLVWIVVWLERVRSKRLGGEFLAYEIDHLAISIQKSFPSLSVSAIGGNTVLEQIIWSLVLATILFPLFRLVSRFAVSSLTLQTIAGATAIAAFPFASLFLGLTSPDCCSGALGIKLALELIAMLTCGIFLYSRSRFISSRLMILALGLHFAIWAWVTSSYVNIPAVSSNLRSAEFYQPWRRTLGALSLEMAFHFGFPVIGFLSSLTWVWYLRGSHEKSVPTGFLESAAEARK